MSKLELKPCCEKLKEEREWFDIAASGLGINVMGCCRNCYVLEDLKFCPFCGKKLTVVKEKNVPPGYVIATSEQKEKYEKPRDYLFRHKSGGTSWSKGPSLDGKWCPGEYAVRVDHVWRSREAVRDACLECGEDVTVGKTWTTCTVCKYAITTHAYRQGLDDD